MAVDGPFVDEVKFDEVVLSRLIPDEDLFAGLKRIAKDRGIAQGVVLSGIGSLKDIVFRNVKHGAGLPVRAEDINEMREGGPVELLSLGGNLFPLEGEIEPMVHLHVMFGSPSGTLMGGHLLKATVFTTVEIVIGKIAPSSVSRAKSELTGLMELVKR